LRAGQARPLPSRRRIGALAVLLLGVVVWTEAGGSFADTSEWVDVTLTAAVLMPATLAVAWVALPLATARGLPVVVGGLLAVALLSDVAGLDGLFNAAKLLAFVLFGYWFLTLFEELWWIVLVALVIPWVDIVSVWAGPTHVVVEKRPDLFERISIAFVLPGDETSANLGPPDVIFLALFLATAARFGLRVAATFICTTLLLGLTLVLAVVFDLSGLPALPAVSLGFLLPNADLIWADVSARRVPGPPSQPRDAR
jgi:hypothetical protein